MQSWMITDVITTRPEVPVEVAIRKMVARQRKILPVVDDRGRLIASSILVSAH